MNIKIKDIPLDDRPRERLIKNGSENLSNEDLLTILIKSGTKNKSAKTISLEILKEYSNIHEMQNIPISKLKNINGLGEAKITTILAAIELGKRVYSSQVNIINKQFKAVEEVYKYYKEKIKRKQECFYTIYLDNQNRIIEDKLLFIGTINKSLVHPREIFKEAYLLSASSIICVHNHPSGDITPSNEDIEITKKLKEVGNLLGIKILDHIIIGNNKYYSFIENGNI